MGRTFVGWAVLGAWVVVGCGEPERAPPPSSTGGSAGAAGAGTGGTAGSGTGGSTGGTAGTGASGGAGGAAGGTGGTGTGGTSAGGTSAGGTSAGGTSAGGTSAGGTSAGGTSAGGTSAGGTSAGGTSAGGTSAGGTSAGGTSAGGTSAGGTSAGGTSAGGTSAGGTGGSGPGVCGDGVVNGTENCDAQDFGGITCQSYGFDDGLLVCGGDCTTIDRAGCTGTENCGDGRDNDGDGRRDCLDSDCLVQCADSCGSATPIGDPATVTGDIAGRPRQLEPSCLAGQASGPERVYRFTAAATGVLEAQLTSGGVGDFSLSARGSCATPSTEFDCSERDGSNGATETVRVDVTQGQQVDLIVDGTGATATGTYTLTARTRPSVCGDLITDPSEECDDGVDQITGLPVSGDGCDEACIAEEDELESNGTTGTANAYNGFYMVARLYPLGDVDVFWFDVVANQRVTATVSGFGNLCADRRLDSVIELLSPAGAVLLTDDDGGVGYCSSLQSGQLPAGRYYVRVTGGAVTTEPVAYKLQIALGP